MQTFLPLPSFMESAACLDNKRLGKQRVEAWQILRTLRGETTGWRHHPAVRMWAGYEDELAAYGLAVCTIWRERGYQDTLAPRFARVWMETAGTDNNPPWLGDPDFHASHRSNLLRKDPAHYGRFGWTERPDLPYVWPVSAARAESRAA